jgi:hypothetical protein
MAQRSGLFDSTEIVETIDGYPKGNRAETADFFAKYFSNFISNGIFAKPSTNFQVVSAGGMNVVVKAGCCFINGYMAWDSEDEVHTIPTSSSSHTYWCVQRAHLIGGGEISKTWLADNDASDVPRRTETYYDLVLGKIEVPANVTAITDNMITDYRYNKDYCGVVQNVLDTNNYIVLPGVNNTDNGKFMRVVDGAWAADYILNAEVTRF